MAHGMRHYHSHKSRMEDIDTMDAIIGMTYRANSDEYLPPSRRAVYVVSNTVRDSQGLRVWVTKQQRGAGSVVVRLEEFQVQYAYTAEPDGRASVLTPRVKRVKL